MIEMKVTNGRAEASASGLPLDVASEAAIMLNATIELTSKSLKIPYDIAREMMLSRSDRLRGEKK